MEECNLYQLFQKSSNNDFFLIYRGVFSDDLTDKLMLLNEKNVQDQESLKSARKRISFLLVESFQNVLKYGLVKEQQVDEQKGMFILRQTGGRLYITSVNLVQEKYVEELTRNLDKINETPRGDLKTKYVDRLSDSSFSTEKGAGLGWMEMVRKSNNLLDYAFEKHSESYRLFYLTVSVGDSDPSVVTSLKKINRNIYHYFIKQDILLSFKTHFSQEKIQPVWKVVLDNLSRIGASDTLNKRRFMILVALTQNISKYGLDSGTGILQIQKKQELLLFQAGNYISQEQQSILENKLSLLASMNKEELHKHYMEQFTLPHGATLHTEMGLIEVYKYSKEVTYSFTEDLEKIFYQIEVII